LQCAGLVTVEVQGYFFPLYKITWSVFCVSCGYEDLKPRDKQNKLIFMHTST